MLKSVMAAALAILIYSCSQSKKKDAPAPICQASCLKDSLKFGDEGKEKPYVYITAINCGIDSIFWGVHGIGSIRGVKFNRPDFKLDKDKIRCLFNGSDHAYLLFNDCETKKGMMLRMPFGKEGQFVMSGKGINNADPKFSIADNLVVNTDEGNLHIEDISTGKKTILTFGNRISIDFDAIHESIDSVNITNTKAWAKVKMGDEWKVFEKNLEFK
jgi:hypothetical protein